jgi:hypothetical protein
MNINILLNLMTIKIYLDNDETEQKSIIIKYDTEYDDVNDTYNNCYYELENYPKIEDVTIIGNFYDLPNIENNLKKLTLISSNNFKFSHFDFKDCVIDELDISNCKYIGSTDIFNAEKIKNIILDGSSSYSWHNNEYMHIYGGRSNDDQINDTVKYLYCTDLFDYIFLRNLPTYLEVLRINSNFNPRYYKINESRTLCSHLDNLPVSLNKIEMSKCYEKYKDLIKLPFGTELVFI